MRKSGIKLPSIALAVCAAIGALLLGLDRAESDSHTLSGGGGGCPSGYMCGSIKWEDCCGEERGSCECTGGQCLDIAIGTSIPKNTGNSNDMCVRALSSSLCCTRENCDVDPPGCLGCLLNTCTCEGSGSSYNLTGAYFTSGLACGGVNE